MNKNPFRATIRSLLATAAAYREEGREPGSLPQFRYVTGSLLVDYHKPTPLGPPIELRATIEEIKERKTIVLATVSVQNIVTAKGRLVAVRMPDRLREGGGE